MLARVAAYAIVCAMLCALLAGSVLPISATAPDGTDEPVRYGYTTTEGNVRYVYELIREAVTKEVPAESFEVDVDRGVTSAEVRAALRLFLSDYPECFWVQNAYNYAHTNNTVVRVLPVYSFTGTALTEAKAAFDAAVESILAEMPRLNTWDTALYLHDLVAERVDYVKSGEHQTAYGALVSGQAVCAGYAAAYQLLLREAGIAAWTVTGSSVDPSSNQPIPHAWNLVWLDADTCVWTDVTWDDQGDQLYHAYFQLSLAEISTDHAIETDIFTVPSCEHTDQSYFDRNYAVLNMRSSASEAARLFGAVKGNTCTAAFIFEGDGLELWMEKNLDTIYREIGGKGSCRVSYTRLGTEVQITFSGSFSTQNKTFRLLTDPHITVVGYSTQEVGTGRRIQTVTLLANEGYYFPENYCSTEEQSGITVLRVDAKTLKVGGIPTADITLTMPTPTKQTPQSMPGAVFTATGSDCGILSEITAGMAYSTDGKTWHPINQSEPITLTGLTPCTLSVITCGNGAEIGDSPRQEIEITKHEVPDLAVTQPDREGAFGAIGSDSRHEYRTEDGNWTDCNGALTDLTEGVYHIRVKADGSTLASDTQSVRIALNAPEQNTTAEGTATGAAPSSGSDNTGGLSLGCASTLHASMLSMLIMLGAVALAARKNQL